MLSHSEITDLIANRHNSPLDILQQLGGYYECPKNASGKRLGPLVGYAGTYEPGKQYVGDVYANFAIAEEYPPVMQHYAVRMYRALSEVLPDIDVFLGAPRGGESFADKLALQYSKGYRYPEKQVTALATASQREQSQLVFKRHEIEKGERVALVEDVANNFTTTAQLADLVHEYGGQAVALVCIFNRSPHIKHEFRHGGLTLPVISLVWKRMPEYKQEDPAVADDIAAGNVIWKPKDEWEKLTVAMAQAPK